MIEAQEEFEYHLMNLKAIENDKSMLLPRVVMDCCNLTLRIINVNC